ncbi:hypothetical protein LTR50_006676 [Elasticomyces elasticus]|nr:hypothetical protein LTR50_006676 [Elasticomyces elasticus]
MAEPALPTIEKKTSSQEARPNSMLPRSTSRSQQQPNLSLSQICPPPRLPPLGPREPPSQPNESISQQTKYNEIIRGLEREAEVAWKNVLTRKRREHQQTPAVSRPTNFSRPYRNTNAPPTAAAVTDKPSANNPRQTLPQHELQQRTCQLAHLRGRVYDLLTHLSHIESSASGPQVEESSEKRSTALYHRTVKGWEDILDPSTWCSAALTILLRAARYGVTVDDHAVAGALMSAASNAQWRALVQELREVEGSRPRLECEEKPRVVFVGVRKKRVEGGAGRGAGRE